METQVFKELVVMLGMVGSGKSTYCKEKLPDHYRISQDDSGKEAHLVMFHSALASFDKVVVDRQNFNKFQRARYINPARELGFNIKIIWLKTPRGICFDRVLKRLDHPNIPPNNSVLANKILDMFEQKFESPIKAEYDELIIV